MTRDELKRLDAEARRAAQEEFDRPFVLEAGAGTGKTAALVSRVLAWCLGPGWELAAAEVADTSEEAGRDHRTAVRALSGVVAITFTDAAAAEMARRIDAALSQVERGEPTVGVDEECLPAEAVRRQRAHGLRGALDSLEVHTIHAWCRRLLASYPLEAGLHPYLEVDSDGRRTAEVVREVVESRLREAYTREDADFLALAACEMGPREIEAELLALLAHGLESSALEDDPLAPERVAALGDRVRAGLEETLAAAEALRAGAKGKTGEVLSCIEQTLAHLEAEPCVDRQTLEFLIDHVRETWAEVKRIAEWKGSKFTKTDEGLLGDGAQDLTDVCSELAPLLDHVRVLDPELLDRGRRVLGELLPEIEQLLRARGIVSFSALLTETARLLTGSSETAARVRKRIDQLLIDEFQDTDSRQCDIVRAVVLEGPESDRPGLFLVGDPKQSIYGWRNADLAAYDAFVDDVEAAGGLRRQLSLNYRSAPVVLDEVERVAEPVMIERKGVQPRFQKLLACPDRESDTGFATGEFAPIEIWISDGYDREEGSPSSKTTVAEAARTEAAALARDLRALHEDHGVAWKDIGVLFRSRGDWEVYLEALRQWNVPFAAEGDRSYYLRREIIDASALVRCILNPNDHLALLAFLRSTAVGVPDAALLPLWQRDFPSRMTNLEELAPERRGALESSVRDVAAGIPADVVGADRVQGWEHNLLAAIDALTRLRECYRSEPPDVFVERLRTTVLLEASESARFLGPWRIANLDRFFRELALELCEDGDGNRVWRRLASSVLDEEAAEEAAPREIVDDAVQVMTIHGAKGLDFEHVYVMQVHKGSNPRADNSAPPDAIDGVVEYALFQAATPGFDRAQQARMQLSEAERVRTLYVAITRAKARLVLAGKWPRKERAVVQSHADLLRQRRGEPVDVNALFQRAGDDGEPRRDAAGVRWFFPALLDGEGAPAADEESADTALPSLDRVESDSRQLEAARRDAGLRQRKRFGGAASGDVPPDEWRERRAEDRRPSGAGGGGEVARAVGTAVHRALEEIELDADPAAEMARLRQVLERELRAGLTPAQADEAIADAAALLETLEAGPLLAKLRQLAVVARELPLLVPPDPGEASPAEFVSGAVDLIYRDPETEELVVADYKTDAVPEGTSLAEHGLAYQRQGHAYQRGVREALGLAYTPRFELWFLRSGAIECITGEPTESALG
jgi:ATP-dependent helicase/nuclease subunit A